MPDFMMLFYLLLIWGFVYNCKMSSYLIWASENRGLFLFNLFRGGAELLCSSIGHSNSGIYGADSDCVFVSLGCCGYTLNYLSCPLHYIGRIVVLGNTLHSTGDTVLSGKHVRQNITDFNILLSTFNASQCVGDICML